MQLGFANIFMLMILVQGCAALRNVRLVAPEAVRRGSKVVMKCQYDVEQETLYAVKWYRGDREFCRYSPRDVPPLKVFQIPGIDVLTSESDSENLTIEHATRTVGGRYTCEVSADAPSFLTAQVHTVLHVVDLPNSGPEIHGLKHRYRAGMKLKAECVARNSMPPANLSFFINNEPASSQHVWHRIEADSSTKLMTAYSTIQFVVQKHNFVDNRIKIRCTAIIYSIYHKSIEKSAVEEREKTTTTGVPQVREAIVFPIHRLSADCCSVREIEKSVTILFVLLLIVFR